MFPSSGLGTPVPQSSALLHAKQSFAEVRSQTEFGNEVEKGYVRGMSDQLTISQLARAAAVPTTTVRYYERIGLVEPEGRSQGNYRLYGEESLNKLKFIRAAQATGLTLDDVKVLLSDGAGGFPDCGTARGLIEARLADIENRLKDLRHVRRVLTAALEECRQQEKTDCCHVVEKLHAQC